ncbi:DUF6245 family protein [Kitasatospora sp. GP82]|uniref:DUF6245 family protein n=1 Tax=Kitasatospora sp. GP82 TaxID=3035089 RepID=UPI002477112C|nr:DUF6245 family protein [Kitasatospora sp. GP82]MDH6129777.1 hypothetical protein [Kitasatospora sp. GP82]
MPGLKREDETYGEPVTVEQIGAALAALGLYDGVNNTAEREAEAARLGGPDAYPVRMVNALLGAVQTEAMLADAVELDEEARHAAGPPPVELAAAERNGDLMPELAARLAAYGAG